MLYIIFGVSGIGKTTIGKGLSEQLDLPFYDADDFHPPANLQKMSSGIPLNDEDRAPWLYNLSNLLKNWQNEGGAVLACSALKESYRTILQEQITRNNIHWVFLNTDFETIQKRMEQRTGHFMKSDMLKSQFDALETPQYGQQIDVKKDIQSIISEIMNYKNTAPQFGVIGLGVMGKSLALNMSNNGIPIAVYNRQVPKIEVDIAKNFVQDNQLKNVLGFDDLKQFVQSIPTPRNILLMVNAGKPVDFVIADLLPLLAEGDVIIDGGNSHFLDTKRRNDELNKVGLFFMGMGVSGGEEGALKGPSIMPSGHHKVYNQVAKILEKIAAKDMHGNPCCTYVGPEGSGHFIKTIHNGIEYAEMQLIAELYHCLRHYHNFSPSEIATLFTSWNSGALGSFLLEISIDILNFKDRDSNFLIDKILDKASQKGTGGWSTIAALDMGKPLSTISESVMARFISAMKDQRVEASKLYDLEQEDLILDLAALKNCYTFSRIVNHAIGFDCIAEASETYSWNLNLSEIARIWTNGCIIRSKLMEDLVTHFKTSNKHLLLHEDVAQQLTPLYKDTKSTVANILNAGCTVPVLSSSLNYFLGFVNAQSSANMIQAQRDYFGAHTYQRKDDDSNQYYHTQWT